MKRLLAIEFDKIRYHKASKSIIITYFALLVGISLFASIKFDIGPIQFHLAELGIFNFPFIWHFNTYIAAILKFFLLLVIVSMTANEYSYKTIKQNLIDGLSKKEFILSKFYMVVVFSAISTLFVFVVSLILGFIYSDFTELSIVFTDLQYLVAYFFKLTAFFSFGLFLGLVVRKSAYAIGAMFIWFLFELYMYFSSTKELSESASKYVSYFFPLKSMSELIPNPFERIGAVKTLAKQVGEDLQYNYELSLLNILAVSLWTAVFIFGSYYLLKQRDL
jgi:ABC-type transport system involved in multi-copper enzyme maturation permease subunit